MGEQLQYDFDTIGDNGADTSSSGGLLAGLVRSMQLRPSEIMLFSSAEHVLRAGRELQMHTCCLRFGAENWKAGRAAKYNVNSVPELRNAIEDLNGISYR